MTVSKHSQDIHPDSAWVRTADMRVSSLPSRRLSCRISQQESASSLKSESLTQEIMGHAADYSEFIDKYILLT
jgi:hypothetical protein